MKFKPFSLGHNIYWYGHRILHINTSSAYNSHQIYIAVNFISTALMNAIKNKYLMAGVSTVTALTLQKDEDMDFPWIHFVGLKLSSCCGL